MAYSDKLLLASQRENECHNYYPCSPFYGEECLSSFDEEIAALINYMQSLGLVNLKDDDKLFIIEQIVQAKRANKQRAYSESELEEYRKCLERRIDYLQAIYSESTKIAVRAVTMEWDRNAGRFYIKETHRDPAPINPYRNNNSRYSLKNYKDFLDFLNHPPLFRGYC